MTFKKGWLVVLTIATNQYTDGKYNHVFETREDACDYIVELGEEYAALSEYGGWECKEDWSDDQRDKVAFEYYLIDKGEQKVVKSISAHIEECSIYNNK